MFNRGAAILSVIDEMENRGTRVELWAVSRSSTDGNDRTGTNFRVKIKDASEQWSPSSVAFALCHTAYNRRLMFRIAESFKHLEKFVVSFGRGGSVIPDDFDVWFPFVLSTESDWAETPEGAMKYVAEQANNQLSQKEQSA